MGWKNAIKSCQFLCLSLISCLMLLFEKVFQIFFFKQDLWTFERKKWWYHNTIHKTYMSMVISFFENPPKLFQNELRICFCMIWFYKTQSKSIAKKAWNWFCKFSNTNILCFLLDYSYVLYHHEFAICNPQTSIVLLHTPWKIVFAFVWFIQFEIASDAPQ